MPLTVWMPSCLGMLWVPVIPEPVEEGKIPLRTLHEPVMTSCFVPVIRSCSSVWQQRMQQPIRRLKAASAGWWSPSAHQRAALVHVSLIPKHLNRSKLHLLSCRKITSGTTHAWLSCQSWRFALFHVSVSLGENPWLHLCLVSYSREDDFGQNQTCYQICHSAIASSSSGFWAPCPPPFWMCLYWLCESQEHFCKMLNILSAAKP